MTTLLARILDRQWNFILQGDDVGFLALTVPPVLLKSMGSRNTSW